VVYLPSEKYDFVTWEDGIPDLWKVIKFMFQTTKQLLCTRVVMSRKFTADIKHPRTPASATHHHLRGKTATVTPSWFLGPKILQGHLKSMEKHGQNMGNNMNHNYHN